MSTTATVSVDTSFVQQHVFATLLGRYPNTRSKTLLHDAIDTILGGCSGNFNMDQLLRSQHPEVEGIVEGFKTVWNVLHIIREACYALRFGHPLGEQPDNTVDMDLSFRECIIMGVMIYHSKWGIQQISQDDLQRWYNYVLEHLGEEEEEEPTIEELIRRSVMQAHDEEDNDNSDHYAAAA